VAYTQHFQLGKEAPPIVADVVFRVDEDLRLAMARAVQKVATPC
jgi:hypothetical protein